MRRLISIILSALVCTMAFAHTFQPRNNILVERNYYNPASRHYDDGIFLKGYALYEFNLSEYTGKKPLDLDVDFMMARKNYSVFASLAHDGYSYFNAHTFSAGYNHIFNNIAGTEHCLRVGGRAVLEFSNVDLSKLAYGVEGKHLLVSPDFDLGVEYQYRFFHLGLSVKNVLALGRKIDGVEYINWPRAYLIHTFFDIEMADGKVLMNPFFVLGMNQTIMLAAGMDLTLFKFCRLGYNFRAPDLHHNINARFTIAKRVILGAGYSVSSSHRNSSVHMTVTVKLDK